jgi:hypothetical protein
MLDTYDEIVRAALALAPGMRANLTAIVPSKWRDKDNLGVSAAQ